MSNTLVRIPGGAQPDNNPRGTPASNEVTLLINGTLWKGWTAVRIGRGIERFPSDFEVALTERYPGEAGVLMATPGQTCVLRIGGGDTVVTGAIDRHAPGIGPGAHEVRIHGRSRCRALVDCSAGVLPDGNWITQVAAGPVLSIAQQMAKPFGISVSSTAAEARQVAPQFNVNLGETPQEIIDRISRWAGLLYYDDVDGNVVLAKAGNARMASGFQQGVNCEVSSVAFSADQRFSHYIVVWMSDQGLVTQTMKAVDGSTNGNSRFTLVDNSQPSIGFRPHVIVCEQVDQSTDFARTRAVWEMNRRNGRSRAVTITTDTWRDSAGKLWAPNALVKVTIPTLKITGEQMLIGEVTYRLDAGGTHADLLLMPPGAYAPEPFNLQPINRQVAGQLSGGAQKNDPGSGAP